MNSYPSDDEITAWLDGSRHLDTTPWGTAFAGTRLVLKVTMKTLAPDDPMHGWARYAERHFPEAIWLPSEADLDNSEPAILDPFRLLR